MPSQGRKRPHAVPDEDDLLIDYLEKKLGFKGDKRKAAELLDDVAKVEFGGETKLFDILDTVLEGRPSKRAYPESGDETEESHSEPDGLSDGARDGDSDGSEDLAKAPATSQPSVKRVRFADKLPTRYGEDVSEEEEDAPVSSEVSESTSEGEEDTDDDGEPATEPATPGTPVKPDAAPTSAAAAAAAGKYVPPHLRQKAAQPKGGLGISDSLAHTIRSTFNRVGEGNLNVMIDTIVKAAIAEKSDRQNELLGTKTDEEVQEVVGQFMDALHGYCAEQCAQVLKVTSGVSLLAPQIALLCALALTLGKPVLARFLGKCLPMFEACVSAPPAEDAVNDVNRDCARQCVNAFSLISLFGFVEPELVVAFAEHVALTVETLYGLELLTILHGVYGAALKTESNEAYRSLKTILEHLLKQLEGVQNMQTDWVRLELAGGEKKTPLSEKLHAMRVWLRRKASVAGVSGVIECYNAATCLASFLKGELPAEMSGADAPLEQLGAPTKEEREHQDVLELARRHHIKSPLQQRVFVAITASAGPTEACEKLLGCMHNNKDIEPAIAMLYFCLLKEKKYNPFYAQLASKLCNVADAQWQKKLRHAIRSGMFTAARSLRANGRWAKQQPKLMAFMGELTSDLDERDSSKMWALLNES